MLVVNYPLSIFLPGPLPLTVSVSFSHLEDSLCSRTQGPLRNEPVLVCVVQSFLQLFGLSFVRTLNVYLSQDRENIKENLVHSTQVGLCPFFCRSWRVRNVVPKTDFSGYCFLLNPIL